ncbi:MAG: nucleotidyltransferase domain-containing protein [Bacteroidetes bacterium]|nr:nucleotidyltransferase domain-containing protein [Bacteroidota bacterium]
MSSVEKNKIMQTIVDYLKNYKVIEVGFFGSFMRDEMNADSDIDILVKYNRGTTLFDIVKMKMDLTEKTGRNIDLVDKEAVFPKVMEYIQKDLKTVYHA